MANNTHYHVLQDKATDITSSPLELSWKPANEITLSNPMIAPVLSYRADPSSSSNNLTFKVTMQNQTGGKIDVGSITLSGTVPSTVFEVLPTNGITKNGMKFTFERTGGVGNVAIIDVIVWFHRDV